MAPMRKIQKLFKLL